MEHIAILTKKYNYIEAILEGKKTIESRWYVNKIAPWNKIKKDQTVYLKNSGGSVIAKAEVKKVLQFENLTPKLVMEIYKRYGNKISPNSSFEEFKKWSESDEAKSKKHCILIFLKKLTSVKPFQVSKKGFGNACAWMCVENVENLKRD